MFETTHLPTTQDKWNIYYSLWGYWSKHSFAITMGTYYDYIFRSFAKLVFKSIGLIYSIDVDMI